MHDQRRKLYAESEGSSDTFIEEYAVCMQAHCLDGSFHGLKTNHSFLVAPG